MMGKQRKIRVFKFDPRDTHDPSRVFVEIGNKQISLSPEEAAKLQDGLAHPKRVRDAILRDLGLT
jgi:hypothetical protein